MQPQPSLNTCSARRNSILDFLSHKLSGRACPSQISFNAHKPKLNHGLQFHTLRRVKSSEALITNIEEPLSVSTKPVQRSRSESTHLTDPPARPLPPHRYVFAPRSKIASKLVSEKVFSRSDIAMIKTTSFDDMIKKGFVSPCSSPSIPSTPTSPQISIWLSNDSDQYQPTLKLSLTPDLVRPVAGSLSTKF